MCPLGRPQDACAHAGGPWPTLPPGKGPPACTGLGTGHCPHSTLRYVLAPGGLVRQAHRFLIVSTLSGLSEWGTPLTTSGSIRKAETSNHLSRGHPGRPRTSSRKKPLPGAPKAPAPPPSPVLRHLAPGPSWSCFPWPSGRRLTIGPELHVLPWATSFSTYNILFIHFYSHLFYLALSNTVFQLCPFVLGQGGAYYALPSVGVPLLPSPWTL